MTSIILAFCGFALYEWLIVGLVLYCGYGVLVGALRTTARGKYAIARSDMLTDVICGLACPMFTITQLERQIEYEYAALRAKDPDAESASIIGVSSSMKSEVSGDDAKAGIIAPQASLVSGF